MISIKYVIIPSILELSYQSDSGVSRDSHQKATLLSAPAPSTTLELFIHHLIPQTDSWTQVSLVPNTNALFDLKRQQPLEKSEKSSASCPLLLQISGFGFCTWCSLANEGPHNHTFVYLRYVCKCYPQGAGWSLALHAHSQE